MLLSQKLKVVIVEDDPMVQRINEEFLSKFSVFEWLCSLRTIQEAKVVLKNNQVDLLLLDVYLPDGLGMDLLKWIRKEDIDTDVIMITADKRVSAIDLTRRYGAFDYLVKPFKFQRFSEALARFVSLKSNLFLHEELNQEEINTMLNITNEVQMDEPVNITQELIFNFLKNNPNDGYTASTISKELGISRITARRYLEELERGNYVKMELSYGGVGRPQNLYHLITKRNY